MRPTQVFILGAGLGTRLQPLTALTPKPLIPLCNKALIEHILEYYYAAGIREFIINTHYMPEAWTQHFPSLTWKECPITLSHETTLLDSGGGLREIRKFIHLDRPLLVHNGDILTNLSLEKLIDTHEANHAKVTLALRSIDGKKNVGFDPETQLITDMRYALGVDRGTHQFAGLYVVDPSLLEIIPEGIVSIVPTWLDLIKQGKLSGINFDEALWNELGTPEDYLNAHLQHPCTTRIHPTASIHPEAHICPKSYIGAHAHIGKASITESIVFPHTDIPEGTTLTRQIATPAFTL